MNKSPVFIAGIISFSPFTLLAEDVTSYYQPNYQGLDFSSFDSATGGDIVVNYALAEGPAPTGMGNSFDVTYSFGALSNGYLWDVSTQNSSTWNSLVVGVQDTYSNGDPLTTTGLINYSALPDAPQDYTRDDRNYFAFSTNTGWENNDAYSWQVDLVDSSDRNAEHSETTTFNWDVELGSGSGEGAESSEVFRLSSNLVPTITRGTNVSFTTSVPEPSSALLISFSSLAILLRRKRA